MDNLNCWHCRKPGHYKNRCPDLVIEGIDNLNISTCGDAHTMFSTGTESQECEILQECSDEAQECTFTQAKGVRGLLHPNHLYINMCASYTSTPYRDLLDNIRVADKGNR